MSKVKLGDIVCRIKDLVDKDNTDLIYYIGGEHFDNRSLTVTRKGIIKGSTIGPAFSTKFKAGDVLLMSRNPHLRKAGIVNFDGICSDVSYIIRARDENVIMQKFIPILFQSDIFWEFAEKNKKGSTNFFLNWSDFERFEFDLPDIETQQKLCDELWAINDTIDSYKEMIRQSDDLIKAKFLEMFGDLFNGECKYSTIAIRDLVDTKIEKASKLFTSDDEICYIDISSIDNSKNIITKYNSYKKKDAPSRAQQVVLNSDILVSTVRPNLNNVAMVTGFEKNLVASSGFCVLRTKKEISYFLFGIVKMLDFANYLSTKTNGANYPAVTDNIILDFQIPNVRESIMEEFSNLVKDVEFSKEGLFKNIFTLENLSKKILTQNLTKEEE